MASPETTTEASSTVLLPRVTIRFCTQCKWMLRAAYFAQELLSTFSTSLGEVGLIPSTGGVFTVEIIHSAVPLSPSEPPTITQLWDRKTEGGFPEVKHLKQLVRNVIDPTRDLGHVDRDLKKKKKKKKKKKQDKPGEEVASAARDGKEEREEQRSASSGDGDAVTMDTFVRSIEHDVVEATSLAVDDESKTGLEKGEKMKEDCEDCA